MHLQVGIASKIIWKSTLKKVVFLTIGIVQCLSHKLTLPEMTPPGLLGTWRLRVKVACSLRALRAASYLLRRSLRMTRRFLRLVIVLENNENKDLLIAVRNAKVYTQKIRRKAGHNIDPAASPNNYPDYCEINSH